MAAAALLASVPRDFWAVSQKMGPDFAMSLGFWAVLGGRCVVFLVESAYKTTQKSQVGYRARPDAYPPCIRTRGRGCRSLVPACTSLFSRFAGVPHRLPFDVAVLFALKAMRRIESVFLR